MRMSFKTKILSTILISTMLISMLSACSDNSNSTAAQDGVESVTLATVPDVTGTQGTTIAVDVNSADATSAASVWEEGGETTTAVTAEVTTAAEVTTTATETTAPVSNDSLVYKNDFETSLDGWQLRGGSTGSVEKSSGGVDGSSCLKMTGRTANWHGAAMDGKIFINGETYILTAMVKQTSGKPQTIGCKFQYTDDAGAQHYDDVAVADVPSGEWVKIEGTAALAAKTNGLTIYFEMGDQAGGAFSEGDFFIDNIVIEGKKAVLEEPKNLEEFYDDMIKDSLITTGNNTRIKNVIEKAKSGKDVTIAYIGGSITEGANSSPNSNCYAQKSCEAFAGLFGTGSNVHYVNAGMSGTPSCLGVIRYEGDVLDAAPTAPDIVFIEFAVNDGDDVTGGVAYESMIRNVLNAENKPAVVLLYSVFKNGLWNLQSKYIPLGEKYELPMISIKNAISPKINSGVMTNDQFFANDGLHPTNDGHQIMADCITYMFTTINGEAKAANDITIPNPYWGNDYEGIKLVDSLNRSNSISVSAESFSSVDTNTGKYLFNGSQSKLPNNWKHSANADNTPFTMTANCKNLMLVYKFSNSTSAGKADVYVDGKLVTTLNSYKNDGWNNATTAVIFKQDSASSHTIEVKMADDSLNKEFTILAIGCTE